MKPLTWRQTRTKTSGFTFNEKNGMKKINTLFLLPAFLLASCSDPEMNTYPARSDEAFFQDTEYSYVASADLEDSYAIEVVRANPSGKASVGVQIEVENPELQSAFTAPQQVEFTDGEYASSVKVSFDWTKLTIGVENAVTVKLLSETDLPYDTECTLTVVRDYTWKEYAKGTYSSGILPAIFNREMSWEQTLEVAEENSKLYRIADLYHNAGTSYSTAGCNLTFTWDGSETISFTTPADKNGCVTVPSGFVHPSYGMLYMYIVPSNTNYNSENKTFTFMCCGLVSAGQLTGWGNDTFVLE